MTCWFCEKSFLTYVVIDYLNLGQISPRDKKKIKINENSGEA